MHGPRVAVGARRQKAYLIAILDDHSRLITHAEFYLNERLLSYVECLRQALLTRGLPRKLYVDNGSAFRCKQLEQIYHRRPHGATGQSPFARFSENLHCIRSAPENLNDFFRHTARRRVAKDRTVILNGCLYEAPVALIGCQVELLYHPGEKRRVEVRYRSQSYGFLQPVDVHVNCRVKRNRNQQAELSASEQIRLHRGGALWSNKP